MPLWYHHHMGTGVNIRQEMMETCNRTHRTFGEAVMAGVFTVPGDPEGAIDFAPIFQVLAEAGYGGWLMVEAEQEAQKANPLDYARMARAYLREAAGL